MRDSKADSQLVKAGMLRVCKDFDPVVAQFGFARTRAASRSWQRESDGLVDRIQLHRLGSSYGAPRNNSVDIRVYFATHPVGDVGSGVGFDSDRLLNANARHYHLRFNALSWSTYDRCLEDLELVLREHGLPWFARQRIPQSIEVPRSRGMLGVID